MRACVLSLRFVALRCVRVREKNMHSYGVVHKAQAEEYNLVTCLFAAMLVGGGGFFVRCVFARELSRLLLGRVFSSPQHQRQQ